MIVRILLGSSESTYQIIISSKNNYLFLVGRDLTDRFVQSRELLLPSKLENMDDFGLQINLKKRRRAWTPGRFCDVASH